MIAVEQEAIVTDFVAGEHGQDLIDDGYARLVLAGCGTILHQLHALDPALLDGNEHSGRIQHGDFGPNNILFDRADHHVVAVLDWEFCKIGPPITDLAWCEWIVRMHHPEVVGNLAAFFEAYGSCPSWADRQEAGGDAPAVHMAPRLQPTLGSSRRRSRHLAASSRRHLTLGGVVPFYAFNRTDTSSDVHLLRSHCRCTRDLAPLSDSPLRTRTSDAD